MKKLAIIAALGAASSLATQGQGLLFANYYSSTQTTGVSFSSGPLAGQGVGSEFTAQLYWGAAGLSSYSSLTAVGLPITFVTQLGYPALPGGAPIGGGSGAGWFGTALVSFGSYATTYSIGYKAIGTYLGVTYEADSPIIQFTTAASSSIPIPSTPASLQGNLSAVPIPEPTTLALGGLGGLALLLLRRKQS